MEHAISGKTILAGFHWIWVIVGLTFLAYLLGRFCIEKTTGQNGKVVTRLRFFSHQSASELKRLKVKKQRRTTGVSKKQQTRYAEKHKRTLGHIYGFKQIAVGLSLYVLGVFSFSLGLIYALSENTVSRFVWQAYSLLGILGITVGIYIVVSRHQHNPFRKKFVALKRDAFLDPKHRFRKIRNLKHAEPVQSTR